MTIRVTFDGASWTEVEAKIVEAAGQLQQRKPLQSEQQNGTALWTRNEVEEVISQAEPVEHPFCPTHKLPMRFRPAGISRTKLDASGQPLAYGAFYACPERGCRQTVDVASLVR